MPFRKYFYFILFYFYRIMVSWMWSPKASSCCFFIRIEKNLDKRTTLITFSHIHVNVFFSRQKNIVFVKNKYRSLLFLFFIFSCISIHAFPYLYILYCGVRSISHIWTDHPSPKLLQEKRAKVAVKQREERKRGQRSLPFISTVK
jgi:hypothetical protein